MNILILGSGGREHAFAWKLHQSELVNRLYVAPGNAGTGKIAQNVDLSLDDFDSIGEFCLNEQIDVVIPGSEDPLVNGIVDFFQSEAALEHIYVFGPNAESAQLEGSKDFAKIFMEENHIPTAGYKTFNGEQIEDAYSFLRELNAPYVLKADGLAAGKGVVICPTLEEADQVLREMLLDSKFGRASSRVVIEEFLDGIEFSVFVMTDGEHYAILPEAKDYKRIGEGDTGLNTGGMGAVSPVPFVDKTMMDKVVRRIVEPTMIGLKKREMEYVGFIFIGLISVNDDPYVIEYNVRMGDPETEVVMPRLKNDFAQLLDLCANKRLNDIEIEQDPRNCTTVFTVSGGYPEAYEKGKNITLDDVEGVLFFHAGTKKDGDSVVTSGGRVLACSAFGQTLEEAINRSYEGAESVKFEGKYFRKDIAKDLMN